MLASRRISPAYRKPHTRRQHRAALTGGMTYRGPARRTTVGIEACGSPPLPCSPCSAWACVRTPCRHRRQRKPPPPRVAGGEVRRVHARNGVSEFPDPDASGALTIDGIANGSSLDTSGAAFKQAIARARTCSPRGSRATRGRPGSRRRASSSPSASATNGVKDFPDPTAGCAPRRHEPDPVRRPGRGMTHPQRRDAAVPRLRAAGVVGASEAEDVGAGRSGRPGRRDRHRRRGRRVRCGGKRPRPRRSRRRTPRRWSGGSSRPWSPLDGTLTYRARSDGSPYSVINQARGTYTKLPDDGDQVDCGDVLYRVDDNPVLLLCGTVPAYRDLHTGDVGEDVRQLNRNLHQLGYDAGPVDPDDNEFTGGRRGARAAPARQGRLRDRCSRRRRRGLPARAGRGSPRCPARPGDPPGRAAPVAQATSDPLEVQVALAASQQGEVARATARGSRCRATGR